MERARLVPAGRARESLELFLALPLELHDVRPLVPRAWSLRRNLTAYDAAYVALAEALDAPLLTLDCELARATNWHSDVAVIGM
jgi:predicted nucleic acid-binding protein